MSKTAHPPVDSAVVEAARRRHATALRSYAVELLHGDRARAQAAVEEALEALAKSTETDERQAEWLFAEVRRRAVTAQRGAGLAQQFDASAENDDVQETAENLFARLTPKQQEVLRLKFVHGFRHEEIARIVELSAAHAAQLLHNALRRLARAFRAAGDTGDGARADDFRLTLAALRELDGEAWRAWEAGQVDAVAANARMEQIRRAGKWAAAHIARGGGAARKRGAKKRRRGAGWWFASVAGLAIVLVAAFVGWRSEVTRTGQDEPGADERGGVARVAVRKAQDAADDETRAVAGEAATLGVYRASPGPARSAAKSTRGETGAAARVATEGAGGANAPERESEMTAREPLARPTGASDALKIGGPPAVKEGAEDALRVTGPTAEKEVAKADRGGPGRSALPYAEQMDTAQVNESAEAAAVASTDTAAIVALKRALGQGRWPRAQDVNVARLQKYFASSSRQRVNAPAFAKSFEATTAPWSAEKVLLRAAVTAPDAPRVTRAAANVILLLDVSGSMDAPNRLPLVQEAVRGLLDRLQPDDRVGLVTYAGESRVLLGPTPLTDMRRVREAVQALEARGRTNGGAGLAEAFALARRDAAALGEHIVIWCTDGEFNVGPSSEAELAEMVRGQVAGGVRLAVFGFGRSGQIDPRLEQLAALAGGGSGYVNTRADAIAVLLGQLDGLIAPAAEEAQLTVALGGERVGSVAEEKLLPGESLAVLAAVGGRDEVRAQLSYQRAEGGERGRERFGWDGSVKDFASASPELRFAVAVERFAELLAGPPEVAAAEWDALAAWAGGAVEDAGGYRAEFLALVAQARAVRGQERGR